MSEFDWRIMLFKDCIHSFRKVCRPLVEAFLQLGALFLQEKEHCMSCGDCEGMANEGACKKGDTCFGH